MERKKMTSDEVPLEQWLQTYGGSNPFLLSLQAWYEEKKYLTPKQRRAAKTTRKAEEKKAEFDFARSPLGKREKQLQKKKCLDKQRELGYISNKEYQFQISMMNEFEDYLPSAKVFTNRSRHQGPGQRGGAMK